jgi:hypothetical protein
MDNVPVLVRWLLVGVVLALAACGFGGYQLYEQHRATQRQQVELTALRTALSAEVERLTQMRNNVESEIREIKGPYGLISTNLYDLQQQLSDLKAQILRLCSSAGLSSGFNPC